MSLNHEQQEIAETLYRKWEAQKRVNCFHRQLCRVATALEALSKAIRSELEGGDDRLLLKKVQENGFTADPANLVYGGGDVHDLPAPDALESPRRWLPLCATGPRGRGGSSHGALKLGEGE